MNESKKGDLDILHLKVDMILKAFLSYHGGTIEAESVFDDMKDAILDDLLRLVKVDSVFADTFAQTFRTMPFNGREWWDKGMTSILEHSEESVRLAGLLALQESDESHGRLPISVVRGLRKIALEGSEEEAERSLAIFGQGYTVNEGQTLFDERTIIQLTKHSNKKIRKATLEAILSLMEIRLFTGGYRALPVNLTKALFGFGNDPDPDVVNVLTRIVSKIDENTDIDYRPLLEVTDDQLRYHATCRYLGFDLERGNWYRTRHQVDATVLGNLMKDAYSLISSKATAYMQEHLGPKRIPRI